MHTPVFRDRVLAHIDIQRDRRYIDCTLGEGGHARAIAQMGIEVLALDADASQVDAFRFACEGDECVHIQAVQGNYRDISRVAAQYGFEGCDGVLFDLGLSMRQYESDLGLSYNRPHQPLDMRIDSVARQRGTTRAADVVGEYTRDQLREVFERYGERANASRVADAIVAYRVKHKIETVGEFKDAIHGVFDAHDLPALFQALRIEANDEIHALREGLDGAFETVRAGGHIQVITFHSGEDRIVKLWGRDRGVREIAKYVGRRESVKTWERSAVLRVFEK